MTRPKQVGLWAGLIAVTVVTAHLPSFFHRLLDGDEAIYGSIAALMNTGGQLYGPGGVDNKPPGIFWVYAATFQAAGTYQMNAIHAVGLAVILATCGLLFVIGRDLGGVRTGLLAALFYGVLTAAGNPRLLATNTELLMMLPLTASVLLILRRQWLLSGVLLVVAGAFRQVAAANVLLAMAAILWLEPPGTRRRAAAWFSGGIAAALIAGALVLLASGSLFGFWRWTVSSLYGYASTNWIPSFVWMRAQDSLVPFLVNMAVLWIAAIALATRWRRLDAKERLVIVWLAVAMVGSVAAGHLSWHYFIQAMGPLALAAALTFEHFTVRRWVAAAAALGIAVPALGWWLYDLGADPLTYDFSPPVPQHQSVAAYIDDHTAAGQRVFVWGDWPALYIESDRLMASRFPGFLRGFARGSGIQPDNWDTKPDVWPELQSDFSAHPPALIVDTAAAGWSDFSMYPMSNYPVLAELVASRYHVVATVDRVVIYAPNSP
ncbi:MAG TPA: glycosyltransferase family 39 protein [Candidatus Dormibacteraeota bacterium]|nr:glycosyltransferase family 39 protein [Candidatus Dormibacteraeota bacterium]